MWLYRSGRQSIMMNQSAGSPSSSSVSCEESPPRIDTVDLQSPSDSSMEDVERLPYFNNTCSNRNYSAPIDIDYSYHRAEQSYFTSVVEQQSFQTSSCRFQKALPALEMENQNSRWWLISLALIKVHYVSWIKAHTCTPKRSKKVDLAEGSNCEYNILPRAGCKLTGQASYALYHLRDNKWTYDADWCYKPIQPPPPQLSLRRFVRWFCAQKQKLIRH